MGKKTRVDSFYGSEMGLSGFKVETKTKSWDKKSREFGKLKEVERYSYHYYSA